MDMDLKRSLRAKVDSIAPEYGLFDLAYPSFVRASGYQSIMSASDSVEAVGALLEAGHGVRLDFGREEGFKTWGAYVRGEEDNKENSVPKGVAAAQTDKALQEKQQADKAPLTEEEQQAKDSALSDEVWWVQNFWEAWRALGPE